MLYYVFNNHKYLDLYLLWVITKQNKTFLYRLLRRNRIKQVKYKNTILYDFEDMGRSPELLKLLKK